MPFLTLANYCSKRTRWRRAPPMSCLLQPPTAKMYLDRKLDIRRIIFFTSYRNGNIASTNTSANVEDLIFSRGNWQRDETSLARSNPRRARNR